MVRFPSAPAALLLALAGCSPAPPPVAPPAPPAPARAPGVPYFDDATAAAGVTFAHYDSATPTQFIPEIMGGGVGWIDYDADGWPDLFFVQDGPLRPADAKGPPPTHKLYRNNRDGTFADVTAAAGLAVTGYGQGCAVGDFDNDGFDDLLVTYLDRVQLFRNLPDPAAPGGRRFADVTAKAGLANPHWGTSCGWADLDGDGFLDLYVCNYVQVDLDHYTPCVNTDVNQTYVCPPTVFPVVHHRVWRNRGDGTFEDRTAASGVGSVAPGGGLGVVLIDLDGDGKVDVYAANDMRPAYLFHNVGGFRFEEKGFASGAALMPGGRFMAGMGVAAGDLDGSGRPSLVVANYQDEPTMVFLNRGKLRFQEWSHPSGLGALTRKTLGFGVELFDADRDGNLDVAQANGHVVRNSRAIFKAPFEQAGQLFVGDGKDHFREVSDRAGPYFRELLVGRGLAAADYDNDGLPDLAVTHNAGPARLLRNRTDTPNRWARLELVGNGTTSNRNAVGAKAEVAAGGRVLTRWVAGGGSYLSAPDRRLLVGLGPADTIDRVTITWPDGAKQEFTGLAPGRGWRLTQGRDRPAPAGG